MAFQNDSNENIFFENLLNILRARPPHLEEASPDRELDI